MNGSSREDDGVSVIGQRFVLQGDDGRRTMASAFGSKHITAASSTWWRANRRCRRAAYTVDGIIRENTGGV